MSSLAFTAGLFSGTVGAMPEIHGSRGVRYGELTMLASVFAFTLMQSLARFLGPSVGSWAKTFYRCLLGLVFTLLWMLITRRKIRFKNLRLLLVRGISGAVAITCYFWAIDLIDLLQATLYVYSHVGFAILFAVLFFKEKFHWWMVPPVVVGLAGLYLIVNPTAEGFSGGDLVGLASAVTGGIGRASVRELRKSDSPGNVVLVFMFCGLVLSLVGILAIPDQRWLLMPTGRLGAAEIVLVLLGIGLFSWIANILMTTAFRKLSTSVGSILALMVLPLTAVVAVLYFHEPFSGTKLIGGLFILAAGAFISVMNARTGKPTRIASAQDSP